MDSDFLTIGRVVKVWGRRGELAVKILTDFPDRFQPGERFSLRVGDVRREYKVEEARFHKGLLNLKFEDINDISSAAKLVPAEIQIPASERRTLAPGEVYLSDLIGCEVIENGIVLGTVKSVEHTGAAPLLNVEFAKSELLIPFAEEICTRIDLEQKQIHVKLPEGLRELNQGLS